MQSLVIVKSQGNCQLFTALVIKNINATYSSRSLMLKFNSEIFLLTGKVRSYVSLWFHENTNNCNKIGILHYWRQRRDSYKMEELYFVKKALLIACGINTYYSKQNGIKKNPQTVRAFIKGWFSLKLLKLKGERNFFGKVFWQCRLKNLIWIVKMCSNMITRVANLIGCINIYMECINSEKCSHTKISIL